MIAKICFVQTSQTYYGAERSLAFTAKFLQSRGWEATVISLAPGDAARAFAEEGLANYTIAADRLRDRRDFRRVTRELYKLLFDLQPDLAAANGIKAYLYLIGASRNRWKKVLFLRGIAPPAFNKETLLLFGGALVPPDLLIANSQATLASYKRWGYMRAKRRAVVYPPVPEISYESPARVSAELAPTVLAAGRLHPERGFNYFLRAAANLRRDFPEARFVIAGGDDETAPTHGKYLRQLADALGLDGQVTFTGYQPVLTPLLKGARVYVNCCLRGDGFGRAVLEAMQLGVPVVSTAAGGPAEIVVDGVTGFLVPPGDTDALQVKIALLLRDGELAAAMGRAGLERSAAFTAEVSLAKLEGLLCDLIAK